jgi:hypothetical protein
MSTMEFNDVVRILQLSIAPAALISGVALLTLSTTNRMAHLIDRMRSLCATRAGASGAAVPVERQLEVLLGRARLMKAILVAFTLSMLAATFIVILLFCGQLWTISIAQVVAAMFVISLVFLILGLAGLSIDASMNLKALMIELERQ